jgi:uncharacterized membrane protein YgcG
LEQEEEMKKFAKIALGVAMLGGAALMAAAPASAAVSFGIGVGPVGPAYYPPPPRYYFSCDPYSRFYDPYRCGYGYGYGPAYYDWGPSVVIGGRFGGGWDRGWHGGDVRGGFHGGGGDHGGGGHGHR